MSHDPLTSIYRQPGYLPYAQPVAPGPLSVPNEAFGFWPQGQFAQSYFPVGNPSFSKFDYPDYDKVQVLYAGLDEEFQPSGEEGLSLTQKVLIGAAGLAAGWFLVRKYR